jgi:hypothetical protein
VVHLAEDAVKVKPLLFRSPSTAGIITEGINIDGTNFITWRKQTFERVCKILRKENVVLVRAPPYSGKTALCTLLAHHFQEQSISCYNISMIRKDERSLDEEIQYRYQRKIADFLNIEDKTNRILLIDEAQVIYGEEKIFWKSLKNIDGKAKHIKILFFASYGETVVPTVGTPYSFRCIRGLDVMLCTEEEAQEFFNDFVKRSARQLELSPKFRKYLFRLTGGHIGLLSHLLYEYLNRNDMRDESSFTKFIFSLDFTGSIKNRRGVPASKT